MKKTLKGLLATTMIIGGMSLGACAVDVQEAWFKQTPVLKKFIKEIKTGKKFDAFADQDLRDLKAEVQPWSDHNDATFDKAFKDLLNKEIHEELADNMDAFIAGFRNLIKKDGTVTPDARNDNVFGLGALQSVIARVKLIGAE